ncbi:MAG: glycosyltransferase family 4 protein [Bdellovibrionales bacterium]|jgi:glycosyltransferase involved in cell wall biosynthesis|nr:glycosyltransferase family 4 protein [Bdellovibrionales bacterium]
MKPHPAAQQGTPEGFKGPTTVLFITTRSDSGTAPKQILELAPLLKSMGIRVFIASPVNPPYGYEFKKIADRFIPIPHRDFSFTALWRIRKSIVKHGVKIVHSHGRNAGVYSRLLSLVTRASVVHSYHGFPAESGLQGLLKKTIDLLLTKIRFFPVFTSQTEYQHARSRGLISDNTDTFIIENAIDPSKFPKRKSTLAPFHRIDRNNPHTLSHIRIGAVLRAESVRGHEHFLKLAQDAAPFGEWSCIGLSKERVERFGSAPTTLEVHGLVNDTKTWLQSLDVFVSTSTSDGQFSTILEAMALGTICVVSDIPAHEPFRKHQAALLFDPSSPKSFSKALGDLRSDKALRDMLIGNAKYMIDRNHDLETFRNKYVDLYRQAAKPGGSTP